MLVVADRMIRDETFFKGRSYCEQCKHTLSYWDLVPLFSFLFLHGTCRYCKVKLSYYYPLSELLTGFVFLLVYLTIGTSSLPQLFFYVYIASSLLVIFLADIKYGIIPDKIVYPALFFTLLFQVMTNTSLLMHYIFSSIGAGGFFLSLFVITKGRGMGFGDVKLAVLMGLLLGFPSIIYALYIAFLTGAFVSLILILWRKKEIKSTIPFGPFLVFGTSIVLFFPQFVDNIVMKVLP